MCRKHSSFLSRGFTILELLVTIGIIAAIAAVTRPGFESWQVDKSFRNNYKDLQHELYLARSSALSRGTTARILLQRAGDVYTLTSFVSPAPVAACDAAGAWQQLSTKTINVQTRFEITGNGVGNNVCFYRDGSSSGGTYNVTQKDGGTDIGSATITVTIATGYLDVTVTD